MSFKLKEVGAHSAGLKVTGSDGSQLASYKCWANLLRRCFSVKVQEKQPAYIPCGIDEEWLNYANFKRFYDANYRDGYHIDKDLLVDGNKVYGPDTCVFIPKALNLALTSQRPSDKGLPTGVMANRGKYQVQLGICGDRVCLGSYVTVSEASKVYKASKEYYINALAKAYYEVDAITEQTYNALLKYKAH